MFLKWSINIEKMFKSFFKVKGKIIIKDKSLKYEKFLR